MNQYHRLSDAQFDSIAAGAGSPDAVAALRAGQMSKHLVMLLAIMDLAEHAVPEIYDLLEEAYDVLQIAQSRAPEAVHALIGHPQVGIWAARCLRRLRGQGADTCPLAVEVGQLGAVAAVAGVLGGERFTLTVPLREQTMLLPTLGLATFTAAGAWAPATIQYDGLRIDILADGEAVEVPADPAADAPGWLGLRRIGSQAPGAAITVELVDIGPTREGAESTHLTRLDVADADRWHRLFDDAWQIIASRHADRAASIRAGLTSIALPEPGQPARAGMSASMRDGFGHFIAAFNDSTLSFAETIVHEFQHSTLTALTDLAPLHKAGNELIHFAPWRQDPRHLEGLLQGTYAFLGITDFWRVERLTLTGDARQLADFEFARWRHQVVDATGVLLGSGKLTAVGTKLVERMRQTATTWLDADVPAAVQALADRTVEDNRLCWRLTNLHPDPGAVSTVAASWRAGRPCPVDVTAMPSAIATDGIDRVSERFLLLRARTSEPARFKELCASPQARAAAGLAGATAADVAYACDDYEAAVAHYISDLAEDPGTPSLDPVKHWAGLALAAAASTGVAGAELLTRAPEMVFAVHRALGDHASAPDPLALAGWLATDRVPQRK